MQAIDNEDVLVDGKRKKKAEILFRDLFSEAIMGNLEAASVIAKFAEEYFGPEAEGPSAGCLCCGARRLSAARLVVPGGGPKRTCYRSLLALYSAGLPNYKVKLNGARITMWEAYVRQVYEMANENKRAARLLQQLRKAFPGDALPGETMTYRHHRRGRQL